MWAKFQFFHPPFSSLPSLSRQLPLETINNQAVALISENSRTGRHLPLLFRFFRHELRSVIPATFAILGFWVDARPLPTTAGPRSTNRKDTQQDWAALRTVNKGERLLEVGKEKG